MLLFDMVVYVLCICATDIQEAVILVIITDRVM
jgi:hypothetical protein